MLKRLYLTSFVTMVGFLTVAASAFAVPGDPPTFSPSTLTPAINDYSTTLVSGVTTLYPVVLVPAAIFTLFMLARKAIGRWIGRGKATSAV
jgi:hypothetical protein